VRGRESTCVRASEKESVCGSDDPSAPDRMWWARGHVDQCEADRATQQMRLRYLKVWLFSLALLLIVWHSSVALLPIVRRSRGASATSRYLRALHPAPHTLQPAPYTHDAAEALPHASCALHPLTPSGLGFQYPKPIAPGAD